MVNGYRDLIRSIRAYWGLISVAEFKIYRGKCSLCGFGLIVQFSATEMGIRCARCRASAVHMSLGFNIARLNLNFASMRAFEMSSRGPFVNFLKKRAGALELSEYWPDIPLGAEKEGISCQNVEQLTFRDSSFHLCTSTEVFEHVSDDTRGFSEIHRVLKPGGWLVNILLLFLAIGAVEWLTMARIMRTQVQSLRQQEFVEAAVSLGLPPSAIIFKHIIPNALGPIIVYTTLTIPSVMLLEAFLSFLGLGIQPPQTSWGLLISYGAETMEEYPWLLIFPGMALTITLFSLNFLGDGLRDALDVRGSKD